MSSPNDPRPFALKAAELLDALARTAERVDALTWDERMQVQIEGGFTRLNANTKWTLELAVGYALTAIALDMTKADA